MIKNDTYTLEIYKGLVNNTPVIYPDYEHDDATDLLKELWPLTENVDGMILQNNWPLDESTKSINDMYDSLPYFNKVFIIYFNIYYITIYTLTFPNKG